MVISPSSGEIKSSAVGVIEKIDAFFVADSFSDRLRLDGIRSRLRKRGVDVGEIPVFYESDLIALSEQITHIHGRRTTPFIPGVSQHTDT